MLSNSYQKNLTHCFNRAAATYSAAATLQNFTGDYLLHQLGNLALTPTLIADIGAGTGTFSQKLARVYPAAKVVLTIDLAEKMLRVAQRTTPQKLNCCLADFDNLPLATEQVDLIYANLVVQWSANLNTTLRELHRVLRPRAHLAFTTLGPATLQELCHCKSLLDLNYKPRVWPALNLVIELLRAQRFSIKFMQRAAVVQYFSTVLELARNLKATGTFYETNKMHKSLAGQQWLTNLQQHYERYRARNQQLPVTYDVIYLIAQKQEEA